MLIKRSKNSYMRSRLKVTMQPIGTPSRNLKFAIAFFALVITGFCPTIAVSSAAAVSTALAFCVASPTPILTVIFSNRGTCMVFLYANSCIIEETTTSEYFCLSRAMVISLI